jgi:hypothetical protein
VALGGRLACNFCNGGLENLLDGQMAHEDDVNVPSRSEHMLRRFEVVIGRKDKVFRVFSHGAIVCQSLLDVKTNPSLSPIAGRFD